MSKFHNRSLKSWGEFSLAGCPDSHYFPLGDSWERALRLVKMLIMADGDSREESLCELMGGFVINHSLLGTFRFSPLCLFQ
jgi:hypothetical protein